MEKDCCNVKVVEMENGFRVEVTGDQVKEKCRSVIESCCSKDYCAELVKKCFSK